jgi:mannose-1-phosphate guanylyltransferase
MSTKVLLLAGGLGTRLRPLTDTTPKCLVPVAGRPLLDYWFDAFADAGISDVLINTHHLPGQVRAYIAKQNQTGHFRVRESYEPTLLGSAGTVAANRDWIAPGDTCLIVYADNLSDVDLSQFLQFHKGHGGPLTMLLFHTPYPTKCGIAALDAGNRIVEFVEKPQHPRSDLANAGVYAVTSSAFHEMADMRKFDLGFDVLPSFVGRMFGWVWSGYHRDIGSPEALRQAESDAERLFGARQGR